MAIKLLPQKGSLLSLLSLLSASGSWAQQAPPAPVKAPEIKFGKPEPADFVAKNFVADSAAAAVVLYDGGTTQFRLNGTSFQLQSERTTRIKILKKAGYEYATVEVPLYHRESREEKILNLKGFTYNEVGGKIEKLKLDGTNIFVEERDPNHRVRKFTLPNVREGAVIEYSYTVVSDFLFNFQPWTFQREIPTRWSEFRAVIPEYFDYKMLMQGYEPLVVSSKGESTAQYTATERVIKDAGAASMSGSMAQHEGTATEIITARATAYHWAMQDVPALREEPYMTTTDDYVARIDFELAGQQMPGGAYHNMAGTWQKINSELMTDDSFGVLLDRGGFLKELVQPLMTQYPDPLERAAAVRQLVLKNVKHDGSSRATASNSLKHIWDQHRGNSADVNLLYLAALRQAGLAAQPVLLSTRAHGRINQTFPLLEQYNYVIGMLPLADNKELLLDATEPLLPCGVLPTRCLNQVGRLIVSDKEGEGRWVSLMPTQRLTHYQEVKMTVDAQGNLVSKVREEHGGYGGAQARGKLAELGEKKYVTELASQHPNCELPSYEFAGTADIGKPLALTYEMRQAASTEGTAQELYLKPLATFAETRNPFYHAQRKFPVDFGAPTQDVVILTLTLPTGYAAELPKPTMVSLPDQGGSYVFSASSPAPGTVQLVSRLTLNKAVYGAEQYGNLREFYRLALAKQSEALVLKKQ